MNVHEIGLIIKESFQTWWRSRASQKGAAIAYFTLFSFIPLLYIIISVASVVFQRTEIQARLFEFLGGELGRGPFEEILQAVERIGNLGTNPLTVFIGIVFVYLGASAVIHHIQGALDELWEYHNPHHRHFMRFIRRRSLSFLVVASIAALVFLSLLASSILGYVRQTLDLSFPPAIWLLNTGILFLFVIFLLALLYRLLSHGKMPAKSIWIGAMVTSLLLLLGKYVLAIYFSRAHLLSFFGAAQTFVLIMVWFYYLAQIFLFGGALIKVHARTYHSHDPRPSKKN